MYHGVVKTPLPYSHACFVEESTFRDNIEHLKHTFQVLPLVEAVERLQTQSFDRPTAAITLDDGLQNNHDVAFPILQQAGLPATVFLTTELVNTGRTLWYCHLNWALAETRRTSLECWDVQFDLASPNSKAAAASAIEERLKTFPHPQLQAETQKIITALGCRPDSLVDTDSPFRILNNDSINRMIDSGLVTFGAHTHSHAILSLLSREEQLYEITSSLELIQTLTGSPCEVFAYPNGRRQDYDEDSVAILKDSTVKVAVTTINGANDSSTPPLELRRYAIGAGLCDGQFNKMIERIIAEDLR